MDGRSLEFEAAFRSEFDEGLRKATERQGRDRIWVQYELGTYQVRSDDEAYRYVAEFFVHLPSGNVTTVYASGTIDPATCMATLDGTR